MFRLTILIYLLAGLQTFAQSTWGDYTFYCPKSTNKGYLIDMSGNVYHTWTFPSNKPTGYSSYLLPGGVVLRTVIKTGNYFTGGPICGEVQKIDWNGNVIWDYVYSTTEYCTHHDICPMPNGNVLLIAYEAKTPAQVTAAGCSQSITMWPDKIVEVQPVGTNDGIVVWEWKVWDHLCQNYDPAKSNYVTSIVQHPELLNVNYHTQKDWMHVNGVDYNEELDQVAFSSHNLNEIYVIDHSTTTAQAAGHTGGNAGKGGDFLYRWGNPAAYQATGTTIFNVVHDAHWIPADCPRANYLVGFNNKGGAGQKNCIDLINPPYSGAGYAGTPGTAFAPSTYAWRHTYSGTPTQNEGQSQQLPNGNHLITISLQGYIYEIDSNQTVVWSKTVSGGVTNARRYTACYVNGAPTVTATATPDEVCAGSPVQLTAVTGSPGNYTYSWASVPAGFTSSLANPVANPLESTVYEVTVSVAGCQAGSSTQVTVYAQPEKPSVTMTGDSLVSSAVSGNQWFLDGDLIPGATGQYLVITKPGSYQVQVSSAEGCQSPMSDPYVVVGTGAEKNLPEVKIWPNPTNGIVHLAVSGVNDGAFSVTVLDHLGRTLVTSRSPELIDLSGLADGLYFIAVMNDHSDPVIRKVILNRNH